MFIHILSKDSAFPLRFRSSATMWTLSTLSDNALPAFTCFFFFTVPHCSCSWFARSWLWNWKASRKSCKGCVALTNPLWRLRCFIRAFSLVKGVMPQWCWQQRSGFVSWEISHDSWCSFSVAGWRCVKGKIPSMAFWFVWVFPLIIMALPHQGCDVSSRELVKVQDTSPQYKSKSGAYHIEKPFWWPVLRVQDRVAFCIQYTIPRLKQSSLSSWQLLNEAICSRRIPQAMWPCGSPIQHPRVVGNKRSVEHAATCDLHRAFQPQSKHQEDYDM